MIGQTDDEGVMIKALLTGFAGVVSLLAVSAAQAAPIAIHEGLAAPAIIQVEGGCGPGGFRAANGLCYPRRPPPPPRYYGRPCPPGFHITPYGCRRNF